MCSPGVTLQPSCLPDLWRGQLLLRGRWTTSGLHAFMGFSPKLSNSCKRKAAGPVLDLSPRLSNWNLSLQNESVQGLAGYCTQGTDCSSKGPFTFKPNTALNCSYIQRVQAE